MKRLLQKWAGLPLAEHATIVLACIVVPVVWLGLRLAGFGRCKAWLARLTAARPAPTLTRVEADRMALCVSIAARCGPIRVTCLPRSMTLWLMLRRHGLDPDLRIGVRRVGGDLDAHAWVEIDGMPLGEADDVTERFAALGPMAPSGERPR